jgi:heterodisulfide reductase subunit B
MAELRYAFFLGCTVPYRVTSYEVSARKVAAKLGIELVEMQDFNCCGLPIDPISHDAMIVLAARNLCLAEQQNLNITTLCTGCAITLRKVNKMLKEDKKLREEVNQHLKEVGMEFKGTIEVKHFAHVLAEDYGIEKIKPHVKKPLINLQVSEHAGCHFLRPKEYAGFDDPEDPTVLKGLIEATGAKYVDYMDKTNCCGYTVIGIDDKISLQLTGGKLSNMQDAGAQAVVTVCPSCFLMFDVQQPRAERALGKTFNMPAVHYTQLLGLAMGMSAHELELDTHKVAATDLLAKIG